jgi:hypothetical protein
VPVAALLHTIVPAQPVAVNVAASLPHRLVLVVLIDGELEPVPIVITTAFEFPLSPQLVLQIAVYVPAVVTLMLVPVEALLHFTVPTQPEAVNVAVSVPHKLNLFELIVGDVGSVPLLMVMTFDAPLSPHLLLQTAE